MQDFRLARLAMVDSQLRPQSVTFRPVLAAMAEVAREDYAPDTAGALAYFDRSLKIAEGRTMMPPAALGRILSELAPMDGDKALIVGSGTGYSAALLGFVGAQVVALESDAALIAAAKAAGIDSVKGELAKGHAKGAPYDVILIDGAVEEIPSALIDQLAEGGRLGVAVSDRGVTRLAIGHKVGGVFGLNAIVDADVDLLPGFERPRAFTF